MIIGNHRINHLIIYDVINMFVHMFIQLFLIIKNLYSQILFYFIKLLHNPNVYQYS